MFMKAWEWLKKYFIPHEGNEHKPHFLRTKTTLIILGCVLFIEACFLANALLISKTNLSAVILQNALINGTNTTRVGDKVPALKESALLDVAAKMKAEDMAAKSYFAHTSPAGITPWYWFEKVGYDYVYAGENLAVNFSDSSDVIQAWLNSPAHRNNLLNSHFTDIGIGMATGMYEGKSTVFIVQMFGASAKLGASPAPAAKPVAVAPEKAPDEMYTSVKGAADTAPTNVGPENYAGTTAPTLVQDLVVSPRRATDYIYAGLRALIALALIFAVFIKIRIQHWRLIFNGVVMIIMINAALILNHYVSLASAAIH